MAVSLNEIVAIMDIEKTTTTQISREFLKKSEEAGTVISISDDLPKSFIVTVRDEQQKVYLSPISTSTLNKRFSKQPQINRRSIDAAK